MHENSKYIMRGNPIEILEKAGIKMNMKLVVPLQRGPLEAEIQECPWDKNSVQFIFTEPMSRFIVPKKLLRTALSKKKPG